MPQNNSAGNLPNRSLPTVEQACRRWRVRRERCGRMWGGRGFEPGGSASFAGFPAGQSPLSALQVVVEEYGLGGNIDVYRRTPAVSIGLLALLDDIVALAKIATASIDDVIGQATKAGAKAAGVVIDDAAVTPRYVVGFAAARELSIVRKIAFGSLKNKLLFLLPAALALSLLAPWAIMPLLMMGGAYLCYEGVEKVYEAVWSGRAQTHESTFGTTVINAEALEDEKVASAIKTDFILSAEIMAITLAAVPTNGFLKSGSRARGCGNWDHSCRVWWCRHNR